MKSKVLIIEDNEQNMYLLKYLLENNGYEVIQAFHGRQGIEKVERYMPALILLDIQLPVMDGYEVARELKNNPKFNMIPIVAVTSYAMPGDREKAMEAGCVGYIEKPINPETFISDFQIFISDCPLDGEEK